MSNWRSLAELYLLPASAALLPWSLAFRWLRFLAGQRWPYSIEGDAARREAKEFAATEIPDPWVRDFKLVKLVDHADLYLSLTRSDRWLKKRVGVSGAWPESGPFIAFTFHWGTGLWVLRHLRKAGKHPAMLSTPIEPSHHSLDLGARYGRLRNWEVKRASGEEVIYLGGAREKIRSHLRQGGAIVALLDVPRIQTRESLNVKVLGRATSLPRGLFALSREEGIPMIPFVFHLDCQTGNRRMQILPRLAGEDENSLAGEAADILGDLLQQNQAAWHRWPDAGHFFPANGQETS